MINNIIIREQKLEILLYNPFILAFPKPYPHSSQALASAQKRDLKMPVFIPTTDPYKDLPPEIIMAENQIRDILRKADCNGDGYLSKDELKKAFKQFGSKLPGWRADRFLKKVDNNHKGQLNMEELDIIVDYALARYKFTK